MVQVLSEVEPETVEADGLVEEASQVLKEDQEQWPVGEEEKAEIRAFLDLGVKEVFWAELEISFDSLIREEGDKEKRTSHGYNGYKGNSKLRVEKPRINDIPHLHRLINYFADRSEILPRPLS